MSGFDLLMNAWTLAELREAFQVIAAEGARELAEEGNAHEA